MKCSFWSITLMFCCSLFSGCGNNPSASTSSVTGKLDTSAVAAKSSAQSLAINEGWTVMAQSEQTGEVYRGMTGADGAFVVDVPMSETGNSFAFNILDQNGRAVGPIVVGASGSDGVTGLSVDGQGDSLGNITLPKDPTQAPINPGSDWTMAGQADPSMIARLDANGVPVGVPNVGKGSTALFTGTAVPNALDGDQDGLVDLIDADDDGDGVVDDFESDAMNSTGPHVNFFMNLKVSAENASTYYSGTADQINTRLATDTVITLDVPLDSFPGQTITGAQALSSPAPAYLSGSSKMTNGTTGLTTQPWSDSGFDFDLGSDGQRWNAFVIPNALMSAGDFFTVEITFADGTTQEVSRMINYVFKNIPRLSQIGVASSLATFDVTSAVANGSMATPLTIDGTQDLVLVFQPPVDDLGQTLSDLDYTFNIFYEDSTSGGQISGIDGSATWSTAIPNWDSTILAYTVQASDLTLTGGTYTVTLPKEIFPNSVQTSAGAQAVSGYQLDLTAEKNGNNAALILHLKK